MRRPRKARVVAPCAALALVGCAATEEWGVGPVDYPGWREDGVYHLGSRDFEDEGVLLGGDDQFVMGLELYGAPEAALVSVEVGFWASASYDGSLDDWVDSINGFPDEEDDGTGPTPLTVEGSSGLELSLGVRKELLLFDGWVRPYVSGGASLLRARSFVATGAEGVEEGDTTWGWYGQAGLQLALAPNARLGVGFRAFDGETVELLGSRGQPDYTQVTFTLGFSY